MKRMKRVGKLVLGLIAVGSLAAASDEVTVTTNLVAGMTGAQVAATFGNAWFQGGDYVCVVNSNTLTVKDLSGVCATPNSRYRFTVVGNTLIVDHPMDLRLVCMSPLVASINFDGAGFVPLVPGPNAFSGGGDTIIVNFASFSASGPKPAMPTWGLLLLGAGVTVIALVLLRPRQRSAVAS